MSAPLPEPRVLADLAAAVAAEAADLVRGHAGVGVAATKSSEVDVVTVADRAAEELIRARLLAARPDDAILGEEGDDQPGTSGVRWIVDPIDGTVNFLYGRPEHAVSIAAEVDGEVVAGVVHGVGADVVYRAHLDPTAPGGGVTTRDGAALAVRGPAPLSQRLLATGFNYSAELRALQATAMTRLLPRIRDIRRGGSCALDLCQVAEGSLDGYVEEGVNLWDHAAGGLIARLAGARVEVRTGVGGRELILAGPGHGFDELLEAVRSAGFLGE
ncbi:inositol monophosphatase [Nocardioides sp. GY 10113]|uniref:inositol monophosphatase family protein n=1 Tax=Nocardioides sp. GY 10113 TaxID=2569761 RepID=UPI0010A7EB5B|nr:inositol monophosphatase family protein [Nocardioides sp. GY 10113]TIC83825.1 inositol monophosphatase [Nocardioides sp. GY 10113]